MDAKSVHYVHLQKKNYHYLFASHKYQLLFVNQYLSHRSMACDMRDYSYQIIDHACVCTLRCNTGANSWCVTSLNKQCKLWNDWCDLLAP
jgi:hypothetical protein